MPALRDRAARAALALAWLGCGLAGLAACRGSGSSPATGTLWMEFQVTPASPAVGVAVVEVEVTDLAGAPVRGGTLRLEGNMSHPGMRPSFADCREAAPGRYRGSLDLTMAGDWSIEVDASFPDGRRVRKTFPLPGVRP